jgi:hypothetical protein
VVYDISRTLSAIIYLKKCHIGMELHPKPMWSIDCMQGKTISGGFGLLGIVYIDSISVSSGVISITSEHIHSPAPTARPVSSARRLYRVPVSCGHVYIGNCRAHLNARLRFLVNSRFHTYRPLVPSSFPKYLKLYRLHTYGGGGFALYPPLFLKDRVSTIAGHRERDEL